LICSKCRIEPVSGDFVWCKPCRKIYDKKRYSSRTDEEKRRTKEKSKKYHDVNSKKIVEYLKTHPCVDCPEKDILVLQFDHINGKDYNVSAMLRSHPWKTIIKEIEKFVVRCANCHIKKTAKQFGWYKTKYENVA
jgi:hypothetical protein